jgi:Family of unknown function (DUF6535)
MQQRVHTNWSSSKLRYTCILVHKHTSSRDVRAFRLSEAVEAVSALLHVATFIFFTGLVDFLFSTKDAVV